MRKNRPAFTTVVTASWSVRLPAQYARIGISRGAPRGQSGYRSYRPLAPGPWFRSVPSAEFCNRYLSQLGALDPDRVMRDLSALADGRMAALLCFEQPPPDPAWCHRSLVSAWLADTLDLQVVEYGYEESGWGHRHPKLPDGW